MGENLRYHSKDNYFCAAKSVAYLSFLLTRWPRKFSVFWSIGFRYHPHTQQEEPLEA